MKTRLLLTALPAFLLLLSPVHAGTLAPGPVGTPWATLGCGSPEVAAAAEAGLDPFTHAFADPARPGVTVTVHLLCPGAGAPRLVLPSDCPSTAWAHNGLVRRAPYAGVVDATNPWGLSPPGVVAALSDAAQVWDAEVATDLFTGFASGGSGSDPGTYDGVELHAFRNLTGTTIRAIYTFSMGGMALESDVAYNTDYAWSTSGAPGAFDLQNAGANAMGHVFGMASVTGAGTACLTMHPVLALGETQKRTLGDGDVLGIQARYP